MMRPDQPLFPNYQWLPIGYHGRASSIVVSGTPRAAVRADRRVPTARASRRSARVGGSTTNSKSPRWSAWGTRWATGIPIGQAEEHLFGVCLLNDWSARDIQGWEYQPLGPFLGKSFATSISPWVVTFEALRPYRVPRAVRTGRRRRQPLPYLDDEPATATWGGLALTLDVWLSTARMRRRGSRRRSCRAAISGPCTGRFAQMVAHHTSGGCNLRSGDVVASGTVFGPDRSSRGCLLELTWRGNEPIELPGGEVRRFLEDGDEVVLRGRATAHGHRGLGFGECRGRIVSTTRTRERRAVKQPSARWGAHGDGLQPAALAADGVDGLRPSDCPRCRWTRAKWQA